MKSLRHLMGRDSMRGKTPGHRTQLVVLRRRQQKVIVVFGNAAGNIINAGRTDPRRH